MSDPVLPSTKTEALYQKHGRMYTHTAPISSVQPLSTLPADAQALFKPPPESSPFILTTPRTIFHAQGGGQPSDTGCISAAGVEFRVHQVRKLGPSILHMGVFAVERFGDAAQGTQEIDVAKRVLHSRIHTAGHVIGLAAAALRDAGALDASIVDGKASHYPGASFVEFIGLIPGTAKAALQDKTDELVARDLPVRIHFWDEARARRECTGVLDSFKQDEDGVRVVEIGDAGSYPCGGTHVETTKGCGRIVIRNIKRQKGVTKVSYEVQDA
ncbi:ThrRS/AlaRS common domain-containing protein [Didymella exigua CBS 183.55]|uniref:ThrRS/AlaRS common domain-containing protein n=1 Tax=Didymella exigua CBS 183.55 TaxID=1150837 RepID=A0A6A5RGC7_9PLEO|nr:ThrRS/AlaRS common domain-containing protein [Didymella exigua CBS 183.55]KAF1926802.1 ThrRS/AlaRS common domain-containing protein [Didymella exigua CBS 183.55]